MIVCCQTDLPEMKKFSSYPKATKAAKVNRASCTTPGKLGSPAKEGSCKMGGHGGGAKKGDGDSAGGGRGASLDA